MHTYIITYIHTHTHTETPRDGCARWLRELFVGGLARDACASNLRELISIAISACARNMREQRARVAYTNNSNQKLARGNCASSLRE